MVTFGAPTTTTQGKSEVAVALGSGAVLFEGAHANGMGWFGRYKYGFTKNFDFGIDAIGLVHSDKGTFTSKIVGRYQLEPNMRLEGGLGVADNSDGKSVNSDIGLTIGTRNENKIWNYYATSRLGYALGFAGNILNTDDSSDSVAPPDAGFAVINIGTQGKIGNNESFIFEGGFGYIFPKGEKSGAVIYLSCGVLFNIGKD